MQKTSKGPKKIIIIRHAEKPLDKKNNRLSPKGYSRAGALGPCFISMFGTPQTIYAAKPKDKTSSMRPIETVTPLSSLTNTPIYHPYTADEITELVKDIYNNQKHENGLVLICWSHDNIQKLCQLLGYTYAPEWDATTFDQYWVLENGKLKIIPQKLLYGDS